MRRVVSAVLVGLLLLPPATVRSAPSAGVLQGTVTLGGRPLAGIDLALVEIETGAIRRTQSTSGGAFEARLAPGRYAVAVESRAGLAVGRAPVYVPLVAGRVASAQIDLVSLPGAALQDLPAPQEPTGTGTTINHDAKTCFVAGEYPLLEAAIMPLENVARARAYFKSALTSDYFYVEGTPGEGVFLFKLPRPKIEASPITYYLQATTTEFGETQIAEVEAIVVEKKEDCEDRPVAAFGPPGEVTVFSAATGTAISPAAAGFGGAALTIGTIALLAGGAAAAGVTAAVTVFTPEPTPSPTPVPTPTPEPPPPPPPPPPTPEPTPEPTPTPTPSCPPCPTPPCPPCP
jgi:hypothetical protein